MEYRWLKPNIYSVMAKVNKSDVKAKAAFVNELLSRGFDDAKIVASPADIVAQKDGQTWYFEIKKTSHKDKYFGAATLTEWVQALKDPGHFRFVVAIEDGDDFSFIEYSPAEFMEFSTIPPFKVYFNIDFTGTTRNKLGKGGAIRMSPEKIQLLNEVFTKMKSEHSDA